MQRLSFSCAGNEFQVWGPAYGKHRMMFSHDRPNSQFNVRSIRSQTEATPGSVSCCRLILQRFLWAFLPIIELIDVTVCNNEQENWWNSMVILMGSCMSSIWTAMELLDLVSTWPAIAVSIRWVSLSPEFTPMASSPATDESASETNFSKFVTNFMILFALTYTRAIKLMFFSCFSTVV